MVSGPVDFVGNYALNFAWKGRKKMFDLLGIRTHVQFLMLLNDKEGTPSDMYEKIVYAGLFATHPELKIDPVDGDPEGTVYVEDIIEQFFTQVGDQRKFDDIVEDALAAAGLINGEQLKFGRLIRQAKNREDIKNALELLDQTFAKAEEVETTEQITAGSTKQTTEESDESGESLGNSQPTSTT